MGQSFHEQRLTSVVSIQTQTVAPPHWPETVPVMTNSVPASLTVTLVGHVANARSGSKEKQQTIRAALRLRMRCSVQFSICSGAVKLVTDAEEPECISRQGQAVGLMLTSAPVI